MKSLELEARPGELKREERRQKWTLWRVLLGLGIQRKGGAVTRITYKVFSSRDLNMSLRS